MQLNLSYISKKKKTQQVFVIYLGTMGLKCILPLQGHCHLVLWSRSYNLTSLSPSIFFSKKVITMTILQGHCEHKNRVQSVPSKAQARPSTHGHSMCACVYFFINVRFIMAEFSSTNIFKVHLLNV